MELLQKFATLISVFVNDFVFEDPTISSFTSLMVVSCHFVFVAARSRTSLRVKTGNPSTIPIVAAERHTVVRCAAQFDFEAKLLHENTARFCHGCMLTPTPNDDVSQ